MYVSADWLSPSVTHRVARGQFTRSAAMNKMAWFEMFSHAIFPVRTWALGVGCWVLGGGRVLGRGRRGRWNTNDMGNFGSLVFSQPQDELLLLMSNIDI